MALEGYWVENSPYTQHIQQFLEKWHYSSYVNIQHKETFTLYREGNWGMPELIGVCVYTRPAGVSAAQKYYPEAPDRCLELRRLCLIDDTPKNAESFFIAKSLRWLKTHTNWEYVISYADPDQGHEGVIYRASNFKYEGVTSVGSQLEVDGELFHIRTLTMTQRPYGQEINRRYKDGDPNVKIVKTKPKHIFTYKL